MSRFFVGQRVRIRATGTMYPELIGHEAVVTGIGSFPTVLGTNFPMTIRPENFKEVGACPDALEPILPEGWQPVEWADCLWQPEGIAA